MEQVKENKMGVMPINKLLIGMAFPMMLSMLVQAMYNIVDSIFVSQIGEDALTAVSLAFPMQSLMIALAGGTCVGVNALLSRSLGEKKFDKANKVACNAITLAIINWIIFACIGFFFARTFFSMQTKDVNIINYGTQYLTVATVFCFGIYLQFTFDRLLQSTGRTVLTMCTQGLGAIINIILDPICIFGLCGMPAMGVTGAAVATVTGQIIAACVGFYFNLKKNEDIKLSVKGLALDGEIIKEIYRVGIPSIIMQSIGSVMTFGFNKILISFTSTATAVFGVYFKLQSFIFMPVFGLNNGMVPIVAYNYGAKNKKRMLDTMKLSMVYASILMVIGILVFQIFPKQLLGFFNPSDNMIALGVPALRIISTHFIFAGVCIIAGSIFQALGNGVYSLCVSVVRQLLVLLPAAYLLSLTGNVNMVWLAFPIAEISSLAISMFFLRKTLKNLNI